MDPIDGKFTAFGWKTQVINGNDMREVAQGPRAGPRRQGPAHLHRLADPQGPGHPQPARASSATPTSTASRSRRSTSTRPWPRSPAGDDRRDAERGVEAGEIDESTSLSPGLRPRPPHCSFSGKVITHGGCFLRAADETRAGQGDPRRVRARPGGARGRSSRRRRGRRRRGQLDPDRVVRQEVPRPVLQHRDRREQPGRGRRRAGVVRARRA